MVFNVETISNIIGDEFVCAVRGSNQNIKIDLKRLTTRQAHDFTDDQKVDFLVEARNQLREAGYNCSLRLSQRNSNGNWTNWPHLWVNRELATVNAADSDKIKKLEAQIEQLQALILKKVEADTAPTPTESVSEDPEF